MNSLTTEQISRVYAMYLGCNVMHPCDAAPFKLKGINEYGHPLMYGDWSGGTNPELSCISWADRAECKLILRPLSATTDEDAVVVAKIMGWMQEDVGNYPIPPGSDLSSMGRVCVDAMLNDAKRRTLSTLSVFQYLIQQGYAVPLFIASNHPDNGKTAIDLGLAITA